MSKNSQLPVFDVELAGCRPAPLASYLKALGILRLVAEQKDRGALGFWRDDMFVLRSSLSIDALTKFFAEEWQPTPVVSPWNGGSGFWPSTSDEALREIEASKNPRLAEYVAAIGVARDAIRTLKLQDAPEKGDEKTELITHLRAHASEAALSWLDAAAVLTDEEPVYPALLGTGGNDGRQDFSNNFMQRVCAVFDDAQALPSALLGIATRAGIKGSMGQFMPSSLSRSNPWDLIFAIEGAMVLSGAATRRLESGEPGSLAFPFHTRASGAPSMADGEAGHGELWLPLWRGPSAFSDVRRLFAEGRAKTKGGSAATGLDFARSVASLGVDRGLSEFVRFSFQPRNGKNYFATAIGRFPTREASEGRLLDDIDHWFDRLRQKATGKTAPARVALARRRLEQAMFEAVAAGGLGTVLLALAEAERALSQSVAFTTGAFLRPVPKLRAEWAEQVADGTVEQRLGACLATRFGMRARLIAIDARGYEFGRSDDARAVFTERPLVENLHALLQREQVEEATSENRRSSYVQRSPCSLSDIRSFIYGEVDDALIERWLRAFVLVDGSMPRFDIADRVLPPAAFAVLALVHGRVLGEATLPRTSTVLSRAIAGDAEGATRAAIARLNAAARPLPISALVEPTGRVRRIAAALAFPLTDSQRRKLESLVLPETDDENKNEPTSQESTT